MFTVATVLSIIGNVLKAFSFTTASVTDAYLRLWSAYACVGSTVWSCHLFEQDELTAFIGTSDVCVSFVSHWRTAQAFGVISTFFVGVALWISILLVVFQERLTIAGVSRYGIITSAIAFFAQLVQFILFITLSNRLCITQMTTPNLQPAPFMYLGGFLFCLVNCALYYLIGKKYKPASLNASQAQPQPAAPKQLPVGQRVLGVELPQQQSRVVVEQPSYVADRSAGRISPVRVRTPTPVMQVRSPVVPAEGGLWPDGDDWQVDEPSGLLWSETKHLFFDRSSGQFFDPKSDQWYDPEADRWYKLGK